MYKILGRTDIEQASLTPDMKEAINIYMTYDDDFIDKICVLKPWQTTM